MDVIAIVCYNGQTTDNKLSRAYGIENWSENILWQVSKSCGFFTFRGFASKYFDRVFFSQWVKKYFHEILLTHPLFTKVQSMYLTPYGLRAKVQSLYQNNSSKYWNTKITLHWTFCFDEIYKMNRIPRNHRAKFRIYS